MTHARMITTLALGLTLAACSGDDAGPPRCGATSQEQALDCLGVPRDDAPRADVKGAALPGDYSPLGPTRAVGVSAEMLLIGMQIAPPAPAGPPVLLANRGVVVELADDATGAVGASVLDALPTDAPWLHDGTSPHPSAGTNAPGGVTTRAATGADLDGDGVDELVVAYLDPVDPANAGVVFVEILGGAGPRPLVTLTDARDVALTRGDFDGDGDDELALAVASRTAAQVVLVDRAADGVGLVAGAAHALAPVLAASALSTELASGNLDRDGGDELVIVLNEYGGGDGHDVSRYDILDDAGHGHAVLAAAEAIRVTDGGSFEAQVADVALGDVDADGKDEIIFGGLTLMSGRSCAAYQHVYLALDDAGDSPAPLAIIGQRAASRQYVPSSGCDEVTVELPVEHVFVSAADVDGDGVDEVVANLEVFDDFRAGAFTALYAIDPAVLAGPDGRGGSALAPATTAITTGDVNGDGRADVVIFAQHRDRVAVWGLDGPNPETAVFREMTALPTASYNSQSRIYPIIAAVNVDHDGAVLKYADAEHRFVFTEPVLIAAVAAAPCAREIGQNLAACTTSYGTSQASSAGVDGQVTISASTFVSFEAKDPLFGIGAEGKASVTATASFSAARAYTLEDSVEYTTGPLEDTVIFTTVPLDQYVYTVVAHPDPEMVGQRIVVNLPRRPVTLQVEREFYNRSVVEGSFQVGANVFLHTPGDLASYPTEADADVLIDTGGLAHLGPLGELVDAAGAALGPLAETLLGRGIKAARAITVGQGGGATTTEIVFTSATDYRAGAEIAFEAELAVTGGGVGVGAGIGATVGAGLSWGTSTSTTYRGSLGSIAEASFAEHLYSAGLFTYVFNYGNPAAPQFEVVNYWVER
ncbi:MAG: VCBS repeat-containing protein [Myxococcales bacterium]|nr:VCBS repeat-containing protein [Myxococcales bacterium]